MVDVASPRMRSARQAAFIGVGAMVSAGIFALLGAAVWILFLLRRW
ncbi:hypothetical protein [Actinoplanes sp. NPDC026623]